MKEKAEDILAECMLNCRKLPGTIRKKMMDL
jgi:hypothetical protein